MTHRIRAPLAAMIATLTFPACNDPSVVGIPQLRIEQHQQPVQEPRRVDVLWVIDDSGSMDGEQILLSQGFAGFAERFRELGLDFHLGVTTTDPRPDVVGGRLLGTPPVLSNDHPDVTGEFVQRAIVGLGGFAREAGFETATMALSEPLASGANAGFLREDAILAIVFVSDEDDQSLPDGAVEPTTSQLDDEDWRAANLEPVQAFVERMVALKGGDREKVFVASIVGDPVGDPSDIDETGCDTAVGGFRYAEASASLGGFWRSICAGEGGFTTVLDEIAGAVAAPLPAVFATELEPIEGSLTVEVDGVLVPPHPVNGWQWVEGEGVVFAPTAVPPACASVVIRYRVPRTEARPPAPFEPTPGCS